MPGKRKYKAKRHSNTSRKSNVSVQELSMQSNIETDADTTMNTTYNTSRTSTVSHSATFKVKAEKILDNIKRAHETELEGIESEYQTLLSKYTDEILDTVIEDFENLSWLNDLGDGIDDDEPAFVKPGVATVKRKPAIKTERKLRESRRKRSASVTFDESASGGNGSRKRSMSAVSYFQTPMNRPPVNPFPTVKFTVSKPARSMVTPFTMKRKPKPDEMLISVNGSPVVQSTEIAAPHVYIPLEDGNVLSIQPVKKSANIKYPEIAPHVKNQLMLLKEHIEGLVKI